MPITRLRRTYRKRRPAYNKRRLTRKYTAYKSSLAAPASGPLRTYQKFYPSLPPHMQLCFNALHDGVHKLAGFTTTPSIAKQFYIYYNPIDMFSPMNVAGPTSTERPKCSAFSSFMTIYQEARIRMVKYSFDFTLDVYTSRINPAVGASFVETRPRIDVAIGVVPFSYLINSTGSPHSIGMAGTLYEGVDYYSSLTHAKGAQFFSLTAGGDKSNYKASAYIEGLSHNGNVLSYTSTADFNSDIDGIPQPTITAPTVPDGLNVVLVSFRLMGHSDSGTTQTWWVRQSSKVDHHLHLTNPYPQMPRYLAGDII